MQRRDFLKGIVATAAAAPLANALPAAEFTSGIAIQKAATGNVIANGCITPEQIARESLLRLMDNISFGGVVGEFTVTEIDGDVIRIKPVNPYIDP